MHLKGTQLLFIFIIYICKKKIYSVVSQTVFYEKKDIFQV